MTVNYFNEYKKYVTHLKYGQRNVSVEAGWIITIILILFIGLRPVSSVFSDTVQYAQFYQFFWNQPFAFDWNVENKIFDNILIGCSSFGIPISAFFTIIAFIYFFGIFQACKKIFPNAPMLSYVVYLGAFSTFSYGTDGIKAGAAAAIFLLALAYRENKLLSILFIAISYGFHHSMAMVIASYVSVCLVKTSKYYVCFWIFCLAMAILHVEYFQLLFGSFSDEKSQSYLIVDKNDEMVYLTGFRLDFILYSAVPVLLGYRNITGGYKSTMYSMLYNLYVMTNGIWLLCMYASYSNRIAYLSWFLYPIVLLYPFVDHKKKSFSYHKTSKVVYYHLGFTLFMAIVYYGLLR
ncbi:EpsG family protein [Bacteroidales bacterium KHT7]|nr:EpsG family protein [Bacteroidales bacterium KHT7]